MSASEESSIETGVQRKVDSSAPDGNSTISSILSPLLLNSIICLACFIVFIVINKRYPWCFQPRLARPSFFETRKQPPKLDIAGIHWIRKLFNLNGSELIQVVGLDGAMYLRFFEVGLEYFTVLTIVCCSVLLPINAWSAPSDNESFTFNDLTIENVPDSSSLLWLHVACMYFSTFFLLYIVLREYTRYVKLRHIYYLSNKSTELRADQLSVLIQEIPEELQDDEKFDAFLRNLYPETLANAIIVKNSDKVQALVAQRETVKENLRAAVIEKEMKQKKDDEIMNLIVNEGDEEQAGMTSEQTSRRRMTSNGQNNNCQQLRYELSRLNDKIKSTREKPYENSSAGFATFTTFEAAAFASQVPLSTDSYKMTCSAAPDPRAVHWSNVRISSHQRKIRSFVVWCLIVFLIVFYMIPVTAVSNYLQLDYIKAHWNWGYRAITSSSIIEGIFEGFVPSLALIIFMALLPPVLRLMSTLQGIESLTWIENNVFVFHFLFQFVNLFLVSALSKDLYSTISETGGNLLTLIKTFGDSLPQQSTIFINYIMLCTLGSLPLELLCLSSLILGSVKLRAANTAQSVKDATDPGAMDYGSVYPMWVIIFVLAMTYANIAPLILPFAVLFFVVGSIVQRYMLLYVYDVASESGGQLYPRVLSRMVLGLMVAQITFCCLLFRDENVFQFMTVLPLPFITFAMNRAYKHLFGEHSQRLSRQEIRDLDKVLEGRRSLIQLNMFTSFEEVHQKNHSAYVPEWENKTDATPTDVETDARRNIEHINKRLDDEDAISLLVLRVGQRKSNST